MPYSKRNLYPELKKCSQGKLVPDEVLLSWARDNIKTAQVPKRGDSGEWSEALYSLKDAR